MAKTKPMDRNRGSGLFKLTWWKRFLTGTEPLQPVFTQEPNQRTAGRNAGFFTWSDLFWHPDLAIEQFTQHYRQLFVLYLRCTDLELPKNFEEHDKRGLDLSTLRWCPDVREEIRRSSLIQLLDVSLIRLRHLNQFIQSSHRNGRPTISFRSYFGSCSLVSKIVLPSTAKKRDIL